MQSFLTALQLLNWAASFVSPLAVLAMMGKFLEPRTGRLRCLLRYGAAWIMCNNVIYLGDYVNILYALPAVLALVRLGWRCRGAEWLAVTVLFYTLTESLAASLDAAKSCIGLALPALERYTARLPGTYLLTGLILGLAMAALRRLLPQPRYPMSARMWRLVGLLAALPFVGMLASVALVNPSYEVSRTALENGMLPIFIMLPLFFLTALALLYTATVLASREQLERADRLAGLREVYYQGLRQQEQQTRQLRHDLRNHLTVVQGLLEQGNVAGAEDYLNEMAGSPALRGGRRFCSNETANVVLAAKAEAMEQMGMAADFAVSLPMELPVADMDLAALLGNALDNAMEGARGAPDPAVTVRCRADKGLLMLQVWNPVGAAVTADLSTTKADKAAHGFGIPGMREIAERYGGTLEAGARGGRFELVVCIPL